MSQKVQNVAVIGAGISGVVSALHLEATGVQVTVYEWSSQAGGIWVYDARRPPEPHYPSPRPTVQGSTKDESLGKVLKNGQISSAESEVNYAPPSPCYLNLKNNVPTPLMALKNHPWEKGTPDFVNHRIIKEYVQGVASKSTKRSAYLYRTQVERIWKQEDEWQVQSSTLQQSRSGEIRKTRRVREFDAVVVATGHYHECHVPDIPGLKEWKAAWPSRVQHSKGYREPCEFKDQNILLIGAGASSTDIAREISTVAGEIYQSSRGGLFDLPATFLPDRVKRIGGIKSFDGFAGQQPQEDQCCHGLAEGQVIPKTVTLMDGTSLKDVHRVILGTGYHCSYPFLPELLDEISAVGDADERVLITDGSQIHNLHKDIFYIPDPTLSFIGIPYYTATFTLFEFQAIALAAVYSGKANLPPRAEMRREYQQRLERKGSGKKFHSLRDEEVKYVNELLHWVNRDGALVGAEPVQGHTAEWHEVKAVIMEKIKARFTVPKPADTIGG